MSQHRVSSELGYWPRFEFASGPFHLSASSKSRFRTPYQLKEENIPKGGWSDVALCSGLAALADNHFDRCTLFRCGVIFYAINAPALISIRTITAGGRPLGRFPCRVAPFCW